MWHTHQATHRTPRLHATPPDQTEAGLATTATTTTLRGAGSSQVSLIPAADQITEELRSGPLGAAGLDSRRALCDSGLPDVDMCEIADEPPAYPAVEEAVSRGRWLLGLLIMQSTSSFVLDSYSDLLKEHLVVTLFLTMLVGAGGNAGNQSSIKVIRGLATGAIRPSWESCRNSMAEQGLVGLLLGTGLGLGGFVRVYMTNGDLVNAAAISLSLFLIVMTSVVLGTGLPFVLAKAGVDPANAGTSIQVLMDILGVGITCVTCNLILVQLAAGLS